MKRESNQKSSLLVSCCVCTDFLQNTKTAVGIEVHRRWRIELEGFFPSTLIINTGTLVQYQITLYSTLCSPTGSNGSVAIVPSSNSLTKNVVQFVGKRIQPSMQHLEAPVPVVEMQCHLCYLTKLLLRLANWQ